MIARRVTSRTVNGFIAFGQSRGAEGRHRCRPPRSWPLGWRSGRVPRVARSSAQVSSIGPRSPETADAVCDRCRPEPPATEAGNHKITRIRSHIVTIINFWRNFRDGVAVI